MNQAVLLVDDNAVQAAIRQTVLKRAGYFVMAVLNPQRALEQMQRPDSGEDIALVITDHIMPGMTGAQFVRELRRTHPDTPVLVISGLEEAEGEYEGTDAVFKMKPLLPEILLATVSDLMNRK